MAVHPRHHQQPRGQREQQQEQDEVTSRVGELAVRVVRAVRRPAVAEPRQVGHQRVDLALRLRPEGAVNSFGQLVERQTSVGEMLPELRHRRVALRVADPQVVPVFLAAQALLPWHAPARHLELSLVGDDLAGPDVISHRYRVPDSARPIYSTINRSPVLREAVPSGWGSVLASPTAPNPLADGGRP